jgi:AraC-like DNA-binding protein
MVTSSRSASGVRDEASPSIVSDLARVVLEAGVERGANRHQLLLALGPDIVRLEHPGQRVSVTALRRLLEAIEVAVADPGFAVDVAANTLSEHCGLVGFALLTMDRGGALGDILACQGLISTSGMFRVVDDREGIHVHYDEDPAGPSVEQVWTEAALTSVAATLRDAFHGIEFERVCFRHAAPRSVVSHRRYFGCPVHFGAAQNSLLLPASFSEMCPRYANRAMHRHFLAHARIELAAVGRPESLLQRTRARLAVELARGGPVSLPAVARALGVGERTLRRRLAEECVSFRALVEELRMREAERLLADRERSVTEVSELLGFSEPSAFSRAFRRAFGLGPAASRLGRR